MQVHANAEAREGIRIGVRYIAGRLEVNVLRHPDAGYSPNMQSTTRTHSQYFQLSSNVDILFLCCNVKMVVQEVGWEAMDWIDLAQDREQVNSLMNLRFP